MDVKSVLKKELLESIRNHKFIIIFMGFIFFAVATPPMLKLTPEIMKNQYGSEITGFFSVSALESVNNYLGKNMIQICILIMVLSLGGVLNSEIESEAIVIPLVKGCSRSVMVRGKIVFYSLLTVCISFSASILNVVYSYIVFSEDMPEIKLMLLSSLKVSIYVLFILACTFFFSSIFSKGVAAGLSAMGINILLVFLDSFDFKCNPFKIIVSAANLENDMMLMTVSFTIAYVILFFVAAKVIFAKKKIYK